ncbi:hypothetical protein KXD40_002037 [Peronospora effusa]|uniref:Uncharacterized protein n=1 Tax=Peronospora effusa TaxID=542832 RepID=A0A3M6VD89_9STRA|nr:hypothetical protein DD238_000849 [Peronospora effusa]RQM18231.1 hypothetical protein DD237_000072 [Peronospora effusa]UIZ26677.1 hypothetical protein KXD40_002037 [Peronospora effusa]CAI5725816.1 unnamed protein product [Peronospora effusa]
MQTRNEGRIAPMKKTCQLNDTFEEETSSYDGDKENEVNALKTRRKRKDGARASREGKKKGLSKRQKVGNSAGNALGQESPPIFTFRTKKTSFRKRKTLKLERQVEEEEKNKKRIEDLVAYFKKLDAQKLETA